MPPPPPDVLAPGDPDAPAPAAPAPEPGWRRARVTPSLAEAYQSVSVGGAGWFRISFVQPAPVLADAVARLTELAARVGVA